MRLPLPFDFRVMIPELLKSFKNHIFIKAILGVVVAMTRTFYQKTQTAAVPVTTTPTLYHTDFRALLNRLIPLQPISLMLFFLTVVHGHQQYAKQKQTGRLNFWQKKAWQIRLMAGQLKQKFHTNDAGRQKLLELKEDLQTGEFSWYRQEQEQIRLEQAAKASQDNQSSFFSFFTNVTPGSDTVEHLDDDVSSDAKESIKAQPAKVAPKVAPSDQLIVSNAETADNTLANPYATWNAFHTKDEPRQADQSSVKLDKEPRSNEKPKHHTKSYDAPSPKKNTASSPAKPPLQISDKPLHQPAPHQPTTRKRQQEEKKAQAQPIGNPTSRNSWGLPTADANTIPIDSTLPIGHTGYGLNTQSSQNLWNAAITLSFIGAILFWFFRRPAHRPMPANEPQVDNQLKLLKDQVRDCYTPYIQGSRDFVDCQRIFTDVICNSNLDLRNWLNVLGTLKQWMTDRFATRIDAAHRDNRAYRPLNRDHFTTLFTECFQSPAFRSAYEKKSTDWIGRCQASIFNLDASFRNRRTRFELTDFETELVRTGDSFVIHPDGDFINDFDILPTFVGQTNISLRTSVAAAESAIREYLSHDDVIQFFSLMETDAPDKADVSHWINNNNQNELQQLNNQLQQLEHYREVIRDSNQLTQAVKTAAETHFNTITHEHRRAQPIPLSPESQQGGSIQGTASVSPQAVPYDNDSVLNNDSGHLDSVEYFEDADDHALYEESVPHQENDGLNSLLNEGNTAGDIGQMIMDIDEETASVSQKSGSTGANSSIFG